MLKYIRYSMTLWNSDQWFDDPVGGNQVSKPTAGDTADLAGLTLLVGSAESCDAVLNGTLDIQAGGDVGGATAVSASLVIESGGVFSASGTVSGSVSNGGNITGGFFTGAYTDAGGTINGGTFDTPVTIGGATFRGSTTAARGLAAGDLRSGENVANGDGSGISGTCAVPAADDVRDGVATDDTEGNLELPLASQVLHPDSGGPTGYGTAGSEYVGTVQTATIGAAVRTSLGLAAANLDSQLGGLLTAVQNVQNNTFVAANIPQLLERPDTGSTAVQIAVTFADETGTAKDLDSGNPAVSLVDQDDTDLSGRLGTWTHPATGKYVVVYTNASTDALAILRWELTGTVNGKLRRYVAMTQLVDTTAVDYTVSDRTAAVALQGTVEAIQTQVEALTENYTAARGALLDNLDKPISSIPITEALDAAETQAAVEAALSTYDPPTHAEVTDLVGGVGSIVAAAILVTPANKLLTNASGYVVAARTDGTVLYYDLAGSQYCARSNVEDIYGVGNVAKWADLNNTGDATAIANRIASGIAWSTAYVNNRLRGGQYVLPLTVLDAEVVDVAARLVGVWLISSRAALADDAAEGQAAFMKAQKEWADATLDAIRAGKIKLEAAKTGYGTNSPTIVKGRR